MRNMSRNSPLLILEIESKVEAWARLQIEGSFESLKNRRRNKVDENLRLRMRNRRKTMRIFKETVTKKITTTTQLCMSEKVLEISHEDWVKK